MERAPTQFLETLKWREDLGCGAGSRDHMPSRELWKKKLRGSKEVVRVGQAWVCLGQQYTGKTGYPAEAG